MKGKRQQTAAIAIEVYQNAAQDVGICFQKGLHWFGHHFTEFGPQNFCELSVSLYVLWQM